MNHFISQDNKETASFIQKLLELYLKLHLFSLDEIVNESISWLRYHFNEKALCEGLELAKSKAAKRDFIKSARFSLDEFSKHPSIIKEVNDTFSKEVDKYRLLLADLNDIYKVDRDLYEGLYMEINSSNHIVREKIIKSIVGFPEVRPFKTRVGQAP